MMKESGANSYIEEGMIIAIVPNCHNMNLKVLRDSGRECIKFGSQPKENPVESVQEG